MNMGAACARSRVLLGLAAARRARRMQLRQRRPAAHNKPRRAARLRPPPARLLRRFVRRRRPRGLRWCGSIAGRHRSHAAQRWAGRHRSHGRRELQSAAGQTARRCQGGRCGRGSRRRPVLPLAPRGERREKVVRGQPVHNDIAGTFGKNATQMPAIS